jgi:prolipoprotein diacylglyceryl transferase
VLFGALGAWIACKRYGFNYGAVADSLAPAMPIAQAIGRWGNWFNQELYGRPTKLPWGLHIDPAHRPTLANGVLNPHYATLAYYQPTFLYESIWDVGVAVVVVLIDKRRHFTRGRAFALYVMLYTIGRGWVEDLRIDDAHHWLGLRLNDWTALIVFACALAYFVLVKDRPADETPGGGPDEETDEAEDGRRAVAVDGADPGGDVDSGHTLAT